MTTHRERRFVPYTPEQMYALVAAVDQYPDFLPWCVGARIRSRRPDGAREVMEADLVISFKVFRERYGSRVVLSPPEAFDPPRIDVENLDGPFQKLVTRYAFHPAEGGCDMEFMVDFSFRNRLLQKVAGLAFEEAMKRVVRAFEDRAAVLYAT